MRAFLRRVLPVLLLLASAWLLLNYQGLRTTALDRSNGWQIYELPPYAGARMVIYLSLGLTLPFLAAWQMRTHKSNDQKWWGFYVVRLCVSFGIVGCLMVFVMFMMMALLDSGVI